MNLLQAQASRKWLRVLGGWSDVLNVGSIYALEIYKKKTRERVRFISRRLKSNSPPVAPLTISRLLQLTFDVQILHILISFDNLIIFVFKYINFNCMKLWIV